MLDLNRLEDMLVEVMSFEKINHVDLYGGEIGLLPIEYVEKLIKIFYFHIFILYIKNYLVN